MTAEQTALDPLPPLSPISSLDVLRLPDTSDQRIWVPPSVLEASIYAVPDGDTSSGGEGESGALIEFHEAAARRRAAASKDNTHAGEAMQQLPEVHNPTPKRRWGLGRFALSGNVALGY